MSRAYCVVAFAIALVVFGVVTDVFGMLYTLSTMPGWVQAGAVVMYVLLLALSECFTSYKERVWRGYDYE